VGQAVQKSEAESVAFESRRITIADLDNFKREAGNCIRWIPSDGLVEELRGRKDASEIAAMRAAARLGSEVFQKVLPCLRPGISEAELAAEIEYRMRRGGAQGTAFETIVAFGERSALPHARASGRRLRKNELVVLDMGAILGHYCCDLTRTVYVGRAPKRVRFWYESVAKAHAAACERVRPGVRAESVDAAARQVLRRRGLEKHFIHSTGHGLGLEVHEIPRLARGQKFELRAGNVITIEPGVYVPGVGGIRIEDDVQVTSQGRKLLTTATREFLEL
jgi:Xaa-Pro aminopeptidase